MMDPCMLLLAQATSRIISEIEQRVLSKGFADCFARLRADKFKDYKRNWNAKCSTNVITDLSYMTSNLVIIFLSLIFFLIDMRMMYAHGFSLN